MSQTNPPAPVPEYIRDAQGKLHRISDLLSKKTSSVNIQLVRRRRLKDSDTPYRPTKYSIEDLQVLAHGSIEECLLRFPDRTRSQVNAQRNYARDRLRRLPGITSQIKP